MNKPLIDLTDTPSTRLTLPRRETEDLPPIPVADPGASIVYVVNETMKYNPDERKMQRVHDLGRAHRFGQLVHLLEAGSLPDNMNTVVTQLKDALQAFRPRDYLLLIGNPIAIAAATAIAAKNTNGYVRVLRWNRSISDYQPVELNLF